MDHYVVVEYAIQKIRKFDGISKIISYGSVSRGTASSDSDIDIAIILDDFDEGDTFGHQNAL